MLQGLLEGKYKGRKGAGNKGIMVVMRICEGMHGFYG